MIFQTVQVGSRQRGFHFQNGRFQKMLGPGRYHFLDLLTEHKVEMLAVNDQAISSENLDAFLADARFKSEVEVIELMQQERALLWRNGVLSRILGPGRHVFWKNDAEIKVERLTIDELAFDHKLFDVIVSHPDAHRQLYVLSCIRGQKMVLFVNEKVHSVLEPGRYAFWRGREAVRAESLEMREQQVDVAGQEILTRDNVTLRITLVATWRIVDPLKMQAEVNNALQAIYRELQIALRAYVGGLTLDKLLEQKENTGAVLLEQVAPRIESFGAKLCQVGLKDVILPGEMKRILNQVIEAEKQARANLVMRREETAATRSLQNTAKLIENNPTLLRLKELEVAERIAAQIDSIQISSGLDELINRLVPSK